MRDEHATAIAAMGTAITPEMVDAAQRLYAAQHPPADPSIAVTRDVSYGPNTRNRLDVFSPGSGARPVVVYVHGGGFVRGDKVLAGTPYYDNVGLWAASQGFVGVTMTHRLAPAHRYPAGIEDLAAALGWLRANVASYGGDPQKIVLIGQSAGAAHAAMYVARPDRYPDGDVSIAGVALFSGIYDFTAFEAGGNLDAYLGQTSRAEASSLAGVVASGLPVLVVISELDPPAFQAQAMRLTDALFARDGRFPNVLFLPRHNHISQVTHLGATDTDDPLVAIRLAEFVRTAAARVPVAG
jgi:triacylglycerol lipase